MDSFNSSPAVPLPIFPLEIWMQILSLVTKSADLPAIWQSCRLVSRLFKAATERVFYERHLPRTRVIYTDFYGVYTRKHGSVHGFKLDLNFECLSEDGTRAFFEDRTTSLSAEVLNDTVSHTRELVRGYFRNQWEKQLDNVAFPQHVLAFRRICNDTELPGLEADPEKFRISFLWREALSKLFGESTQEKKLLSRPYEDVVGWPSLNFSHYVVADREGISVQDLVRRDWEKFPMTKTIGVRRVMLQERMTRIDKATELKKPKRNLALLRGHVLSSSEKIIKLHPMEISDEESDGVDWKSMVGFHVPITNI